MTTLVQLGGELCAPELTAQPEIIRVQAPYLPIGPNFNLIERLDSLRHPSRALSQIGGLGERLNLGANIGAYFAQGKLVTTDAKATLKASAFDMFVAGTDDEHPDPYHAPNTKRFQFRNGVFTWKDDALHPKTKAIQFFPSSTTGLHFVYAASPGASFMSMTEPRYVRTVASKVKHQNI